MLRQTNHAFKRKNKMSLRGNQIKVAYVNPNPNLSPHINHKDIVNQEVYHRKEKSITPGIIPYYGDKMGRKQMRPWDDRKNKGYIWKKVGELDIEKAILKQNQSDYSKYENHTFGRRKFYDQYYDHWFERDGQYLPFLGWHAFDAKSRRDTLWKIRDPRTIINHLTKWKCNQDKGRWWYADGKTGVKPNVSSFNSTEHDESKLRHFTYYNKFILPSNFSDLRLTNQGYYYAWLTKSLVVNNVEFDASAKDESNFKNDETILNSISKMLDSNISSFSKKGRKIWHEGDGTLKNFQDLNTPIAQSKDAHVANALKQAVQALYNLNKNNDTPLVEVTKSESSMFWYRGIGYINTEIYEQPYGWQLHCRPEAVLKSKNGIRKSIASKEHSSNHNIPKYSWIEQRTKKLSKPKLADIHSKFLEDVEIKGWHPNHYRIDWTKYENVINNGGDNIAAGDLYPNYQEALMADKLRDLPHECRPVYKWPEWSFSTIKRQIYDELTTSVYVNNVEKQWNQAWIAEGLSNCWATLGGATHAKGYWWDKDVPKNSPVVMNHVVTDGENVQFFVFQLNTLALDIISDKEILNNNRENRNNVLYASKKYKLYENLEFNPLIAKELLNRVFYLDKLEISSKDHVEFLQKSKNGKIETLESEKENVNTVYKLYSDSEIRKRGDLEMLEDFLKLAQPGKTIDTQPDGLESSNTNYDGLFKILSACNNFKLFTNVLPPRIKNLKYISGWIRVHENYMKKGIMQKSIMKGTKSKSDKRYNEAEQKTGLLYIIFRGNAFVLHKLDQMPLLGKKRELDHFKALVDGKVTNALFKYFYNRKKFIEQINQLDENDITIKNLEADQRFGNRQDWKEEDKVEKSKWFGKK